MKIKVNRLVIRRLVFAVMIIVCAAFQQTRGSFLSFGSANAMLLVPLTVCIAMHERSLGGLFFGVLAGALWDSGSVSVDGFFSLLLAVTGFVCSVLVIFRMRNNLYTCLILSFGALFSVAALHWLFFFALSNSGAGYVFFKYYFSSAVYSLVYAVPFYYMISGTAALTAPEHKRINY